MNKETRQLVKACKKQGLKVDTSGKHIKVYRGSEVKNYVVIARTASDHRALANSVALLRKRFGFKWKGR